MKIAEFYPRWRIAMNKKFEKIQMFRHASKIKLILLQLYQVRFSIKVSINSLFLRQSLRFQKPLIFFIYIGTGVLINEKWQSAITIDISRFSCSFFLKTRALNCFIKVLIYGAILLDHCYVLPYIEILIG